MSNDGKGSAPRPKSVDANTFASNWELVFGRKEKPGVHLLPSPLAIPEFDMISDHIKDIFRDILKWHRKCSSHSK